TAVRRRRRCSRDCCWLDCCSSGRLLEGFLSGFAPIAMPARRALQAAPRREGARRGEWGKASGRVCPVAGLCNYRPRRKARPPPRPPVEGSGRDETIGTGQGQAAREPMERSVEVVNGDLAGVDYSFAVFRFGGGSPAGAPCA